jgi:DNA-binding transcriptional ArsR family regulator
VELGGSPGPSAKTFNQSVDSSVVSAIFNDMVEFQDPQLDTVFHALGDATRRRMLRSLAGGERTVSELAQPFAISLAAASKHIKALERAGLIRREVRGRTHLCRLEPGPLASATEWLSYYEHFWTNRLDILDHLLREDDARTSTPTASEGDTE